MSSAGFILKASVFGGALMIAGFLFLFSSALPLLEDRRRAGPRSRSPQRPWLSLVSFGLGLILLGIGIRRPILLVFGIVVSAAGYYFGKFSNFEIYRSTLGAGGESAVAARKKDLRSFLFGSSIFIVSAPAAWFIRIWAAPHEEQMVRLVGFGLLILSGALAAVSGVVCLAYGFRLFAEALRKFLKEEKT